MALTVAKISSIIRKAPAVRTRTGKPGEIKEFDGLGLYIRAKANGSASWNLKYKFRGQEKLMSFGQYPQVSLRMARERCFEARKKLDSGIDPNEERKQERVTEQATLKNTFQAVATAWLERQEGTEGTVRRRKQRLKTFVFPEIGSRPIDQVTAPELLAVIRKIEAKGKIHTAKRVLRLCSKIWSAACIEGKALANIALTIQEADVLKTKKTVSHAAITKAPELAALLNKIDRYTGSASTVAALKLLPLVFTRPIELRKAEWPEFDLDSAMWVIPAERMKMRKEFMVPLSRQAVKILKAHQKGSESHFVFPGLKQLKGSPGEYTVKPISENTLNKGLRKMGYEHDVHVSHGFRSTASTLLNEQEYDPAVIDLQLAHKVAGTAGIYNRAIRIGERTKLMQKWADYLDKIKTAST